MHRQTYQAAKKRGHASRAGKLVGRLRIGKVSPVVKTIGYIVGFLFLLAIGNLFQTASFGVAVIVVYGILALLFRVKSEDTFKMALVTLIYVIFLTIVNNSLLAGNFAEYAFLLLFFGVLSALFEQRRESKKESKKR